MKRFEYYSIFSKHGDDADECLEDLGKKGCEAFAIVPFEEDIVIYFKRELS